ncbi:MAG: homoserine dehydrogenase [Alphaproteobacteria bacterium]|jgi:homoserine dehydrogenase|nr:homoserine dehydrogenase [Alphaproteobacteria bacterium]
MADALRVAIAGLGTVGAGTVEVLQQHADLIARRGGRAIQVVAVSARTRAKDRGVSLDGFEWYDDPVAMAREASVDVVVELIGGEDGPAKAVCEAAIAGGKHVVTANKALLAVHGNELAEAAEGAGVSLNYEAAIAGGIPIVKALREGLAGNEITHVYGILNGTCNYILTEMREKRLSFETVLEDAQKLGYAEAEPSVDVDGFDAAHKLALLASLAFGTQVSFDDVYTEGIRHVSLQDIDYAEEFGYRIKLLGSARMTEHGLEQRVYPCMVAKNAPIAHVESAYNAVVARGDFVDDTMYQGRGAGAGPTASAVVADIIDIARGFATTTFGVPVGELRGAEASPIERHRGAYYVRLMVDDQPGVIADISAAFRDESVSIGSMLQRARSQTEAVPIVLNTHVCEEAAMRRTLNRIEALDSVVEAPTMIRIESLV